MKKVLVIEDNPEVRENIEEFLELANYDVITAENGMRGVAAAKSEMPDLIICDIMMPELDGYGVLNLLSRDSKTASIPFIFLTAKADKQDFRKGMNLGADDYLTKPFDGTELLEVVERRMAKHKSIRSSEEDVKGWQDFVDRVSSLEGFEGLSGRLSTTHHPKDSIVYRDGEPGHFSLYVLSGRVKVERMDHYGKRFVTDMVGPGQFFGYLAHMTDGIHHETAIAIEDTEVVRIPKSDMEHLLEHDRDVANRFIKLMANNINDLEDRLLKLVYAPVRERTAETLLRLIDHYGKQEPTTKINLPREDLASIVGTATESLIRTLSEFKRDGLINSKGREIEVLDRAGLEKLVGG